MLQNAYLLAKIGADTAENEQHFAKNLRKTDNYPTGGGGDGPKQTYLRPLETHGVLPAASSAFWSKVRVPSLSDVRFDSWRT